MTFNVNQTRKPKWQGKTEKIDGIIVYRIPALNWMPIWHTVKVTAGVNFIPGWFTYIFKNYDIIHFHELEFSFPFFSAHIKKPKILHLHGIDYNFLKRHHLSRFLLKHLAQIYISISKQMMNELVDLGVPKSKIAYLPNSIDTSFFKSGKLKEENMLLFVGRISQTKGLHILLNSLRYLKERIRLVIIGPADWDVGYFQSILKMIENENQKGKHEIKYLGTMEQTELVEWYQKASLFILPSFSEGFPVTILEALACETPVIATPVGGVPEIIKDHKTGILVPVGNHLQLANAIQHLLENENIRLKMGREGRKLVIEQYSIEKACQKLCSIYKQLSEWF
jgi:glycosyltransferase involved in cell wall biosynthesis